MKLKEENGNIMKLFIDFIYNGNCKLEDLDDMLPLMKVVDYYQVNKVPFYLMCGKVILDKLDSSNYLSLLPKFANVMSKESIKKAADKVTISAFPVVLHHFLLKKLIILQSCSTFL